MNSTNVPSNKQKKEHTASVAGSVFTATEKTLEVPPQSQVYEVISSYIEDNKGNMEIPVGASKVNENGTLEMQDGTTIAMVNPQAYKNLVANKQRKAEMKAKAESKGKEVRAQVGVGREE